MTDEATPPGGKGQPAASRSAGEAGWRRRPARPGCPARSSPPSLPAGFSGRSRPPPTPGAGPRCATSPPNPRKQGASASPAPRRISARSRREMGNRPWEVVKRVAIGVYSDGFIHAGNLAYLALLSLFPFVIVAAAHRASFRPDRGGAERGQRAAADHAERRRRRAQDADPRRARGALGQSALVRRSGRPVDDGQLHRDDPRHHPPRLWRHLQPPVLGISARIAGDDHRRGDDRDDRVQRLDPALGRPAVPGSS